MISVPILNKSGKETEKLTLPEEIFSSTVNTDVIHQAMVMYHANQRQGTASTKERGAVSGGGRKPWRQKGTGRARAGSNRSPLWMGGGVVFGPHPRDFSYTVPRKIRLAALRESINAKYQAQSLACVTEITDKLSKTKEFAKILKALKLKGRVVAVLDGSDNSVLRVSRNIPRFELVRSEDLNAFDIVNNKTLLITKTAFNKLLKRITNI